MDRSALLIQCFNAVQLGSLLFLAASGLTLVFWMMGTINLAHGSSHMVGACTAFALAPLVERSLGGGPFSTLAVGLLLSVTLGYVFEWVFLRYLSKREPLQQVITTFLVIRSLADECGPLPSDGVHEVTPPEWLLDSIPLGGLMADPVYRLVFSGVGVLLTLGTWLALPRTWLASRTRASANNRAGVPLGIRPLYRLVFAAGVTLAAFVGMAAPAASVDPGTPGQMLILCFAVVAIGGAGSIRGTLFAAVLVGFVDTLGKVLFPAAAGIAMYLLMVAALVWKPEGLLMAGRQGRSGG